MSDKEKKEKPTYVIKENSLDGLDKLKITDEADKQNDNENKK